MDVLANTELDANRRFGLAAERATFNDTLVHRRNVMTDGAELQRRTATASAGPLNNPRIPERAIATDSKGIRQLSNHSGSTKSAGPKKCAQPYQAAYCIAAVTFSASDAQATQGVGTLSGSSRIPLG